MNDARYMYEIEGFSQDDSLFTAIQTACGCFPDVSTSDLQLLAEEYYMHSSKKKLSPLCAKWVHEASDLTAFVTKIASALAGRYGRNWWRIFLAYYKTDYKPLDNYSMKETRTPRVETTINVNTATSVTNASESKVYGFNSETPVGDNDTTITTTGDKDENETTSVTSYDGIDTLEREGNIGVTTSAQMLQGEIDIRQYDFWSNVFADIDRLLCINIVGV